MPTEIEDLVRDAYASERFEPSYADIVARARGRRAVQVRWLRPLGAVAAMAAVALGVVAVTTVINQPTAAEQAAAWDSAFAAQCTDWWKANAVNDDRLATQHRSAPPPVRFAFRDGDRGLRLYAYPGELVLFACGRDGNAVSADIRGNSRLSLPFLTPPTAAGQSAYLAVLDPSGGPEYVIGRIAEGADRVVVRTSAGSELPVSTSDGLFAAWAPEGGLEGVTVDQFTGAARVAAGPPTQLGGVVGERVVADRCRDKVRELLRDGKGVSDAELAEALKAPRFVDHAGAGMTLFYGARNIMVACEFTAAGRVGASASYEGEDSDAAIRGQVASLGEHSWAFGPVIADAERVELTLTDGRVIVARVNGGWYLATWESPAREDSAYPVSTKVVVYTATTIYTRTNGSEVTQKPR